MDSKAAAAREQNRLAQESTSLAAMHREQRNRLVRQLRQEDPEKWTYKALSRAVGISEELVAAIIQHRT